MGPDEEKNRVEGKGFAGLSSMVSDVDATITNARNQAQNSQSTRTTSVAHGKQSRSAAQTDAPPAELPTLYKNTKLLLGVAVILGAIAFISQSNNNTSSRTEHSSEVFSKTVAAAPARRQPTIRPQAPSRPVEVRPPVGRNDVLTAEQINYCLAEKIRIDASDTVLNKYVASNVARYNEYVDDFNSRCEAFRYRQGALASARRGLAPYRTLLQAEGRSRFARSPSTAATRTQTLVPAPRPSAKVKTIQRRLNELGYDAGPVDGLLGGKTKAAIRAYERNNGIAVGGSPSMRGHR